MKHGECAPLGKLPPDLLQSKILRYAGFERPEVKIGPRIGEDAAVIEWPEGKFLVVSSDPIVGASQGAGRLLVFVNANDIFSKGGEPAFLVVTLILPACEGHEKASRIMAEIDEACKETGIAIVGGHTEFTDRYDVPVIVGTIFGTAPRVLSADDVCPGDVLLMTKHAGLEGMTILAQDRPDLLVPFLELSGIEEIRGWTKQLTIGPEARCLARCARFMHDPTEGGCWVGFPRSQALSAGVSRLTWMPFQSIRIPAVPRKLLISTPAGLSPRECCWPSSRKTKWILRWRNLKGRKFLLPSSAGSWRERETAARVSRKSSGDF
jgi:Hydrogenase maturation factor